ncbi:MAG TPA: FecR family protein [Planctomycetota bacterium]|nr:FecR family protein [Planctomycetota bacterium]
MSDDPRIERALRLKAAVDAGDATDDERRALEHDAAGDGAIADALAGDRAVDRLLRYAAAAAPAASFSAVVAARIDAEADAPRFLRGVRRRLPPRRGVIARRVAALAAALLVVATVAWWHARGAPAGFAIADASADALVDAAPAAIGARIVDGATIACGAGRLVLRHDDGTRLTLAAARAVVTTSSASIALRLEEGAVIADVPRRPPGADLRIATPHGEAVVLGTRFRISVGMTTALAVEEGVVRLVDAASGRAADVGAGGTATIGEAAALERLRGEALAWYDFADGGGAIAHDRGGRGLRLDLALSDPAAATWLPGGGLRLDRSTLLATPGPAPTLVAACARSDALTVVADVTTVADNADDPADSYPKRIVCLGPPTADATHCFSLGQGLFLGDRGVFDLRLRTDATSDDRPSIATAAAHALPARRLVIAAVRAADGACRLVVDGRTVATRRVDEPTGPASRRLSPAADSQRLPGALAAWSAGSRLAVAGDHGRSTRGWLGVLHRVALFDRALSDDELRALTDVER